MRCLLAFEKLATARLDTITSETIGAYVATRQATTNEITTINRQLQVLRRMFKCAVTWGKVHTRLAVVEMLPGERRRDRFLSPAEEALYFAVARSQKMEKARRPCPPRRRGHDPD